MSGANAARPARSGRRRRGAWWFWPLAVAVVSAVALLCAELVLRFVTPSSPVWATADPHCGFRLRAGAEGMFTSEGVAPFRINSDGWRDRERSKAKPPGTLRIAVLGDSFTAAFHVPMERAFWWVVEEALDRAPELAGRRVEVLSFGVPGYGTAQELLALREYAAGYAPDLVLLAFFAANDVQDNARALGPGYRPYFVYRGDELVLDDSFLRDPGYLDRAGWKGKLIIGLSDYSRVVQLLSEMRRSLRVQAQADVVIDRNRQGLSEGIWGEPQSAVWEEAWRVTEGLIARLRDEAASLGAAVAVVQIPDANQVHPDRAKRAAFAQQVGVADLEYPGRRVSACCNAAGIACLDLAPALLRHGEATGELLHGFGEHLGAGHWNEHGHRVAGEAIARWLLESEPWQQR